MRVLGTRPNWGKAGGRGTSPVLGTRQALGISNRSALPPHHKLPPLHCSRKPNTTRPLHSARAPCSMLCTSGVNMRLPPWSLAAALLCLITSGAHAAGEAADQPPSRLNTFVRAPAASLRRPDALARCNLARLHPIAGPDFNAGLALPMCAAHRRLPPLPPPQTATAQPSACCKQTCRCVMRMA